MSIHHTDRVTSIIEKFSKRALIGVALAGCVGTSTTEWRNQLNAIETSGGSANSINRPNLRYRPSVCYPNAWRRLAAATQGDSIGPTVHGLAVSALTITRERINRCFDTTTEGYSAFIRLLKDLPVPIRLMIIQAMNRESASGVQRNNAIPMHIYSHMLPDILQEVDSQRLDRVDFANWWETPTLGVEFVRTHPSQHEQIINLLPYFNNLCRPIISPNGRRHEPTTFTELVRQMRSGRLSPAAVRTLFYAYQTILMNSNAENGQVTYNGITLQNPFELMSQLAVAMSYLELN